MKGASVDSQKWRAVMELLSLPRRSMTSPCSCVHGRCSAVILCRRHQWTKSLYMYNYGLRWVFEKTAYMHILVNNNFIESMEWNTASHCQPNLSTYIVDCFESVSSLYSQLIVHLPVPLTGRIHAVRDCMYYMSDFLHYV